MSPTLKRYRGLWLGGLVGLLLSFPALLSAQATHFAITSGPGNGTYQAGQGFAFHAVALSGCVTCAPVTVTTYNNVVTIGLYDNLSQNPSDTAALYGPGNIVGGSQAVTGQAAMTFVNGQLDFWLTFKTGANEQLYLQDAGAPPVTVVWPGGTFSSGSAFRVQGYSTAYYFQAALGGSAPVSYYAGGPTDNLLSDPTTLTGVPDAAVTIPNSVGVANAAAFAVTGVTGHYANQSASIVPNLQFAASIAGSKPVSYWVILDYSGTLTDYNNPPASDAVYAGSVSNVPAGSWITATNPPVGLLGYNNNLSGVSQINNANVIVRLWTYGLGTLPVSMRYNSGPVANLSWVNIPYSNLNIQPVRFTIIPTDYLTNSSASVTCVFQNLSGSAVTQITYTLPANSPFSGSDWSVTAMPASIPGHPGSSVAFLNPASANNGAVSLNFNSSPMTLNESITLTMGVTVSSIASNNWLFGPMTVVSSAGTTLDGDSSQSAVTTLGVPNTPASILAVPSNFSGTGNQVGLSWGQVTNENANGYILSRRSPTGSGVFSAFSTLGSNSTTTATDSGVTNLSSYDYRVVATNAVAQSPPITFTNVVPYANPGPPTGVTALTGGTTIQLNWTVPVSMSGSYPVSGYQVYRGTSAGGEGVSPITTILSPTVTFNDTGLSAGTTYFYNISAIDNQYSSGSPGGPHDSAQSSEGSGFPLGNPPTALPATLVSSSPATIQLDWTAPLDVLNTPVTGYLVQRGANTGTTAPYTVVGASPVTWNDAAVTAGSYYVYQLAALDNKGVTSNLSNAVTGRVGPSAPTGLVPSASTAAITLIWTANPTIQNVVNYLVNRDGPQVGNTTTILGYSGPVTYVDSTASYGSNHSYILAAVDNGGVTGPQSTPITWARLPNTPSGAAVTADALVRTTNDLSWAVTTAPEGNITGYNLYRGVTNVFGSSAPLTLGLPVTFNYQDTGLSAGTTYFYFLKATNIAGTSSPTAGFGQQTPPNPPGTPSDSPSSSAITVSWPANPGSEKVASYSVYRSLLPASGYVSVGTNAGLSFIDTPGNGVSTGTNYYYKITATNTGGGGAPGGESLLSASVTAALLLGPPASFAVTIEANNTNVDLNWTAPSSSGNLTGYAISRNTTNSLPGSPLTILAGSPVSFTDASLSSANAGTIYYYFLQAQDTSGVGVAVVKGIQIPPTPPTGVTASSTASAIMVNWNAVSSEGVTGYYVYRSQLPSGPTAQKVGMVPLGTNSYNDGGAAQGVTYYYNVTATNPGSGATILGGESLMSAPVTWGLAPPTATGLTIVSIDTSNDIAVTWTGVLGADPNATGVSLLVNNINSPAGAVTTSLAAAAVSFFDNGVFNGSVTGESPDTTYYYWLQTTNPFGPSALTAPVSKLTYPAPASIISAILDADGTSRDLTWTPVGGVDVTKYNIKRELVGASSFVTLGSPSAAGLTFPVKSTFSVSPGASYLYEITAVNATGEGTSQNTVTVNIAPSDPSPVTVASGVGAVTQVNLSWLANAGGENVTGYTVYRGISSTWPASVTVATGIVATNYSDISVPSGGVTYYYWVEADGSNGTESLPTMATSSVTVVAYALPNTPGSFSATPANGSVTLSWSPAISTTYPIASYKVDRVSGAVTTVINNTVSPYGDTSLSNGTTYVYYIQAVDSQGHSSPVSLSSPVTVTPLQPPGPPVNLQAYGGDQTAQITWNAGATGTLPTGTYLVYRSLPGPTTLLATVSSTATGYLDQGLTDGTSYSYYLQSVDSSGVTTGLHISANSVTVSAIPSPGNFNAPSNLVATGGVGQVNLSWSDSVTFLGSAPVTGYTLYRSLSLSSGYVVIANLARGVTTSTYLNSGLANGTTYYYYLTPYASGLAGPSNSATVFAAASRPPNPPAPPSEVDGNNQVVLNWSSAGVTIDGVPVTQYIVNRTPGSPITVYNATTALDATVSNGTSYTYQIQSVNIYGIVSALSAPPVAGNPYVTGLPAPLTSSSSTTAVTLTWNAPTAPASSFPVSTYTILRSITSGNEAPLTVVTATGSPMNFTDSTVTAGQLYYYEVQATDTKGHLSPLSSEIYDGATSQLAAPATFITTAGSQQVLLDWPAPAPALGTLPVSLYILIGPSGGPVTLPASQTWYLDTYASDPTTVVYSLQAVDDTGRVSGSHASTVVGPLTVTTSAFILNPPTALAAKATGPTAIQLTWTKPRDMGQIVASYLIYRSSSFSALGSLVATVPNPALAPATIYVDTGLNPNSVYYYVVQAVYAPSSTASPNSNHAWAATPPPNKAIPPVTVSQMAFDANLVLPLQGQQLGIYYVVPNSGAVEIRIYNVAGDLIRVLNPGSATANQQQSTTWDMKDKTGQWASSGVYFVEIRASGFHQVKKVAVVK